MLPSWAAMQFGIRWARKYLCGVAFKFGKLIWEIRRLYLMEPLGWDGLWRADCDVISLQLQPLNGNIALSTPTPAQLAPETTLSLNTGQ